MGLGGVRWGGLAGSLACLCLLVAVTRGYLGESAHGTLRLRTELRLCTDWMLNVCFGGRELLLPNFVLSSPAMWELLKYLCISTFLISWVPAGEYCDSI